MSDVEIIYLKRGTNTKNNYLKADVQVYPSNDCKVIKNPFNKVVKNKPEAKKSFFNPKKTFYLILCFVIVGIVLSSSFNAGYIPVKSFLEIKEPIGAVAEINIEETVEKYSLPIDEIPTFENVKYKIYGSKQGKPVIEADYIDELKNEGFSLEYRGDKTVKGFDLNYYGFIKGLTAVVIIMTSDNIYINDYNTLVLYSTGSVFDYVEILKDNAGFLKL